MRKITLLGALLFSIISSAQCLGSFNWPDTPVTSLNDASVQVIAPDNWGGDYAEITGLIPGNDYQFDSSIPTYFTVTDLSDGTVIANGYSPLIVTGITEADIHLHIHADEFCTGDMNDKTTSIQCLSCTPPVAPGCATLTTPIDVAVNVAFEADSSILLAWTAPTTGDAPLTYNIYLGYSPTTLNLLGDINALSVNISGLLGSTTYYWQAVPENAGGEATGCSVFSFTTEVLVAPANDDCGGATALTVGAVFSDNPVIGTNYGATDTTGVADPTCSSYLGRDVWFSAVVPASGSIAIETATDDDSITDTGLEAFSGSCGALNSIDCNDDDGTGFFSLLELSGLTVGETIYIRIFSYDNAETGTFTVSAYDNYVPPPANDDCLGATALSVGTVFSDNQVIGTNIGATDTTGIVDPTCSSYLGGDVWFSAVVPASGSISIETATDDDSITDTGLEAFSGSCGALTSIGCNDDEGSGFFSLLELSGLTAGETIYIRIFSYDNAEAGNFTVSAYDASLANASFDLTGFLAYPNPVKDILNLSYTKQISNVSVHNILGQEVLNAKVNALESKINMSGLSSGTYLVKVTVDGLTNTLKVVKE